MSEKLVKSVKLDEFEEGSIQLMPYDDSYSKGDIKEIINRYMTMYSNNEPEVKEHMSDGVHNVDDCIKYIRDNAHKMAKDNCAAVNSDLVFKWAIHYYRCEVEEKIVKEEPKPEYKPSVDFEELKRKREEEEAKRKAEEAEKKRQDEINKNGLSLFDQLFS